MNVLLTRSKDGTITVHKNTCKKIAERETYEVEEYASANPSLLTSVKAASCCKPNAALIAQVEQAGFDALLELAEQGDESAKADLLGLDDEPGEDDEQEVIAEAIEAGDDALADDALEDLIGEVEAPSVVIAKTAKKRQHTMDGLDALKRVAAHLGLDLGASPVFPGYGKAFKTVEKQSVYINSKGNADARARDDAQAEEWANLDHVTRRSGNYVRVDLKAI